MGIDAQLVDYLMLLTSRHQEAMLLHTRAHIQCRRLPMPLLFIGIDPNTEDEQSPTLWVDEEKRELVLQGWKPSPELEAECAAFEVSGHARGIPGNEAVIRIPARMVHMLREACDAVERADIR